MKPKLAILLTNFFILILSGLSAQEIWKESFSTLGKGIWGDPDGKSVHKDLDEIRWTIEYSGVLLTHPDDYAKTVKTSGGRFECRDINGELTWRSEIIDISDYTNVSIKLNANETGSGAKTEKKYLKVYYLLDQGEEILFSTNGINEGNWGKNISAQDGLEGERLQLVIYMNNHYASDKVILDEVVVSGEEKNPVIVEAGDVLINEILFNPVADGSDFVEIYNHSEKPIPLNKLYLASRDKDLELTQVYQLSTSKATLNPGKYLVLTPDSISLRNSFAVRCRACILQMVKLPSFNNDYDHIVLLNNDMQVIDELSYKENMHASLLHNREGISLERTSFTKPTSDISNWHSASSQSGFATPGIQNSQQTSNIKKVSVRFEPEAISPNNDGYNDSYSINFALDKPGYYSNIWIYDSGGRLIRKLTENSLLGTREQITWNGSDKTGNNLNPGVYVVLVEIFDTDGYMKHFKDGVVVLN